MNIAIVGRACLLPGANTPQDFARRILAGDDLITGAPEGRWRLGDRAMANDGRDGAWSDSGGYVTGFDDLWDPVGFGELDPNLLDGLDNVYRWTLHTIREALRDAGHNGNERTHLVMGNLSFPTSKMSEFGESAWLDRAGGDFASRAVRDAIGVSRPHPMNRFMSGKPARLAAQAFGLGDALALDAACASSLYAIQIACDRLRAGEADTVVAGAVNAADPLFIHVGFCALSAMSQTGQSRPFHAGADGLVPAEGAAFVVLKRLEDALEAGDDILGVVRGVGLSNDGRGRGFLAPAVPGQVRAMRAAYEMAGLSPADVPYVECHATGTTVGDAAELESMREVWPEPPIVGSHKSNIGHAITVAGMGGLLKVLAAFEAGVVPPTLHAGDDPTDSLEGFELGAGQPWRGPRRAAVSAFGFGGNNAHLIVETLDEWQAADSPAPPATKAIEPVDVAVIDLEIVAKARARDLFDAWMSDGSGASRTEELEVDLDGLKFPPRDLDHALGQQLLTLEAARRLAARHEWDSERTAVLVGMEADPQVIRFGARWRAREWADTLGADNWGADSWGDALADSFAPLLRSEGVIGTMPNIPANRVNSQLDIRGPSFTVSAESESGIAALDVARLMLARGEVDVAIVGAADCSVEFVHEAASRALGEDRPTADAGALLVLRRAAEVDEPLAILRAGADAADAADAAEDAERWEVPELPTSAYAADALLRVALGVGAVAHACRPGRDTLEGPLPWMTSNGSRTAVVGGLAITSDRPPLPVPRGDAPRIEVFRGADRESVISAWEKGEPGGEGPAILAVVVDRTREVEDIDALLRAGRHFGDSFAFREAPIEGELGFVFTGSASPYRGMGRELFAHVPEAWQAVARRCGDAKAGAAADTIFGHDDVLSPNEQIFSATFLSQAHAWVTREVLGLKPEAAIGYSMGESSALYALGVWDDLDDMLVELPESDIFEHLLSGDYAAIRKAWSAAGHVEAATADDIPWANWTLIGPVDDVIAAVADEPLVHVAMINTDNECVIGGYREACDRVLQKVLNSPKAHAAELPTPVAIHVPEAGEAASAYRALHRRPVVDTPDIRFYSNATHEPYAVATDACADAQVAQATATLDFRKTVERAWEDGVRIFVEHGPRSLCTNWINRILGDREHVAVSLDVQGRDSLRSLFLAAAHLIAAGVPVEHAALTEKVRTHQKKAPKVPKKYLIHAPDVDVPPLPGTTVLEPAPEIAPARGDTFDAWATAPIASERPQAMLRAPDLPSALSPIASATAAALGDWSLPVRAQRPAATEPSAPTPVTSSFEQTFEQPMNASAGGTSPMSAVGAAHQQFIAQQTALYQAYLDLHARNLQRFQAAWSNHLPATTFAFDTTDTPSQAPAPETKLTREASHTAGPPPAPETILTREASHVRANGPDTALDPGKPLIQARNTGQFLPTTGKVVLTREDLEYLAKGDISKLFGDTFAPQAHKLIQCRMPEPPLLLCDRVVGIDAQPASMSPGTMWTETDVRADAWYTHCGRMPAGVMIESGQADLLLVSWLGIDLEINDGRAYRLLGCELTYRNDLPKAGDTLHYEIHIDGFAKHGGVRMFFFHYDCTVNGVPFLEVRGGQAGFFTEEELENSHGILWTPEEGEFDPAARLDPPPLQPDRTTWSAEHMAAFADGRIWEVFGEDYRFTRTHVRTPTVARRDMLFIDEVTDLSFDGGPWGRGYLRATEQLSPDDWFFEGHFHNDPCMPGTLMFEGTLQTMAFWMAAAGVTIRRDGWRFQPVRDEQYDMRCRGQATPESRECVYELFVEEFHNGEDGENPKLFADLLVTVDGRKAFHCRRMGLELVPDYPLSSGAAELDAWQLEQPQSPTGKPPAIDYPAMLATAWGSPVQAFGEMYEYANYTAHRAPRLPGPPYHFMTRVMDESGHMTRKVGAHAVVEYDVPPDAWYFAPDIGDGEMPFAVLLETGLQPCGWLATWVGCAVDDKEVFFRNLDGTGTLHVPITPATGTVSTHTKLTRVARSGGMTIVAFEVSMTDSAGTLIYDMDTMFGFFPEAALAEQAGIPEEEGERDAVEAQVEEFTGLRDSWDGARSRWDLLDRVADWPDGGAAGLGRVRARFDVDPGDWFFKAHFYADPVQPGSIGLEAILEGVRWWAKHEGLAESATLATDAAHTWQYRGQVRPWNEQATAIVDIVERTGSFVVVDASLWCDGQKIYTFKGVRLELLKPTRPTR
jgi:PfaB family protein